MRLRRACRCRERATGMALRTEEHGIVLPHVAVPLNRAIRWWCSLSDARRGAGGRFGSPGTRVP